METIEIKSMTSIEDAVKLVLHTAKLSGSRVVAEFNGFILDSKNSYDKNLDLYWAIILCLHFSGSASLRRFHLQT